MSEIPFKVQWPSSPLPLFYESFANHFVIITLIVLFVVVVVVDDTSLQLHSFRNLKLALIDCRGCNLG
jgi:hypothetical protein